MQTPATNPAPENLKDEAPSTAQLYLGDNGRLTCGALRCAGSTAYSSKMRHDLSGQSMERLTPPMVRELMRMAPGLPIACETCGAEAMMNDAPAIASRFYGLGGPCRQHGVAGCIYCLGAAAVVRPSLEVSLVAALEVLPLEEAWALLRTELFAIKVNLTAENDADSRRKATQLIRFHVHAPSAENAPWRVRLHAIADEVERA